MVFRRIHPIDNTAVRPEITVVVPQSAAAVRWLHVRASDGGNAGGASERHASTGAGAPRGGTTSRDGDRASTVRRGPHYPRPTPTASPPPLRRPAAPHPTSAPGSVHPVPPVVASRASTHRMRVIDARFRRQPIRRRHRLGASGHAGHGAGAVAAATARRRAAPPPQQ
ncbi:hypothetical protein BU14_0134s0007 [Porphyra umbilicalis]|uniref:Uncharacterized protein n=1 Tax=Porphyra umbilicalis TaxID=2786 RepID=A0A1X6PAM5_PORUM|nr:hypothetical protein BU14_0134s0007 [Porphyra umbilicalis]|eukprot:OSX77785.1 hypothetical protein BU14_0134s0007 [Porphyra umbilicalis]